MKIPRDLGGQALVKALSRSWDYRIVNQVGSHVILRTETPSSQRSAVPAHACLRVGTLNAILRAVAGHKGVSREDVLNALR